MTVTRWMIGFMHVVVFPGIALYYLVGPIWAIIGVVSWWCVCWTALSEEEKAQARDRVR